MMQYGLITIDGGVLTWSDSPILLTTLPSYVKLRSQPPRHIYEDSKDSHYAILFFLDSTWMCL